MSPSTPRPSRTVSFAPDPEHIPPSPEHPLNEIEAPLAPPHPYIPPTPNKPAMSERQFGVKTVNEAKRVLEDELSGVIVDYSSSRVLYLLERAISLDECNKYFTSRGRTGIYSRGKWAKIPDPAAPTPEEALYEPLVETFQSILAYFKLQHCRLVRDTHRKPIVLNNIEQLKAVPDIFITGDGEHFSGSISDLAFQQCITSVEVKTEATKNDNDRWVAQMAYYARQCLVAQPSRNFVYGLLITQQHVRIYGFDRCGAQRSEWMDYHHEPHILVQMLLLVCNPRLEEIGVDTTVSYFDGRPQFNMTCNKQPFVLTADPTPRFQALGIRGRSTVCWSVQDEEGNRYLLKQQFVNVCRPSEDITLSAIQGKNIQGVGMPLFAQRYDLVSVSRGMEQPVNTTFHDRYMYRLVLEEHGETIDHVTSRMSLLLALRDGIRAHRDLWMEGILHRDISTNNILYTKDNTGGVLIDFDLAIAILRTTSNFHADFRTGTRAFQSISVLRSYKPEGGADIHTLHDYLDDLESFYWVFLWITRGQLAPEKRKLPGSKLNPDLEVYELFQAAPQPSADRKFAMLFASSIAKLQDGWGDAYEKLARNLGTFLFRRGQATGKVLGRALSLEELIANAPADYATVLKHCFDTAVDELKLELKKLTESLPVPSSADTQSRARAQSLRSVNLPLAPIPAPLFPRESLKRSRDDEEAYPDGADTDTAATTEAHTTTSLKRARTKSTPVHGSVGLAHPLNNNTHGGPSSDSGAPLPRRSSRIASAPRNSKVSRSNTRNSRTSSRGNKKFEQM